MAEHAVAARLTVGVGLIVVALAAAAGWLGSHNHHVAQEQEQREHYVEVARQAAINLTTISYAHAEADVQRIIEATTGEFRDDFAQRSRPFVDVVKQAQSESQGTVTEAGLESVDGDRAQVLLAVSVNTRTPGTASAPAAAGAPAPEPRRWRMRISLQGTADGPKVSNIAFIS